jgi:hypothetical protein
MQLTLLIYFIFKIFLIIFDYFWLFFVNKLFFFITIYAVKHFFIFFLFFY